MRAVALAAMLVAAGLACGDDDGGSGGVGAAATGIVGATAYDESRLGLKRQLADLLAAIKDERGSDITALTARMELTDHGDWFAAHFEAELARKLAAEYAPVRGQFDQLARLLAGLSAKGQTSIGVESFDSADDDDATGYQQLALKRMTKKATLYSARFTSAEDAHGFHLWSFVYVDGSFRWIGKLKAVRDQTPADPDLLELRVRVAAQVK